MEWVLIIIAAITAGFIAWQAWETRRAAQATQRSTEAIERQAAIMDRQTVATKQAAEAARQSADAAERNTAALINSERAWVVPELIPHAYQGKDGRWYRQDHVPLATEEVLAGNHLVYSLRLTNMGRTPAQILGFEMRYACLPGGVRDLPMDAAGEAVEYHEFHHLLRGEGSSVEVGLPIIDASLHMQDSWDAIRRLEKTAVFHGWVKYRHMFSAKEDSYADFCYVYTVELNRLSSVGRQTRQR